MSAIMGAIASGCHPRRSRAAVAPVGPRGLRASGPPCRRRALRPPHIARSSRRSLGSPMSMQATPHLLLAFWLACSVGCASSGMEFRPYLRDMPHKPLLERAVSVDHRDVPALAQAGAIIIGHISAHGPGFDGPAALEESAAREAARR